MICYKRQTIWQVTWWVNSCRTQQQELSVKVATYSAAVHSKTDCVATSIKVSKLCARRIQI